MGCSQFPSLSVMVDYLKTCSNHLYRNYVTDGSHSININDDYIFLPVSAYIKKNLLSNWVHNLRKRYDLSILNFDLKFIGEIHRNFCTNICS
jgi:hypothetical protein